MFPAMRMEQAELMERYPSPQVLRQIMDKNAPLPADPMEHAIYPDQIAFYKIQKAKQEAMLRRMLLQQGGRDRVRRWLRATRIWRVVIRVWLRVGRLRQCRRSLIRIWRMTDEQRRGRLRFRAMMWTRRIPAMATHEEQFYSGLEAVKIINLPPDERMRRILAMPPQSWSRFAGA